MVFRLLRFSFLFPHDEAAAEDQLFSVGRCPTHAELKAYGQATDLVRGGPWCTTAVCPVSSSHSSISP